MVVVTVLGLRGVANALVGVRHIPSDDRGRIAPRRHARYPKLNLAGAIITFGIVVENIPRLTHFARLVWLA